MCRTFQLQLCGLIPWIRERDREPWSPLPSPLNWSPHGRSVSFGVIRTVNWTPSMTVLILVLYCVQLLDEVIRTLDQVSKSSVWEKEKCLSTSAGNNYVDRIHEFHLPRSGFHGPFCCWTLTLISATFACVFLAVFGFGFLWLSAFFPNLWSSGPRLRVPGACQIGATKRCEPQCFGLIGEKQNGPTPPPFAEHCGCNRLRARYN